MVGIFGSVINIIIKVVFRSYNIRTILRQPTYDVGEKGLRKYYTEE
jgi:hypothetical protein